MPLKTKTNKRFIPYWGKSSIFNVQNMVLNNQGLLYVKKQKNI